MILICSEVGVGLAAAGYDNAEQKAEAERDQKREMRVAHGRIVRLLPHVAGGATRAVELLAGTTRNRPGILLGRVQSGKTRAYLGVIARAFDRGYDAAVILTKGTKSLAEQTLSRVREDYAEFIEGDQVEVFDILAVPHLTLYELTHKLVFVVKKEDDNMRRLLDIFQTQYPELRERQVLIIDDEADLASVSGRRQGGVNVAGTISRQIDEFREAVPNSAFLQVTATPYALYLQPDDGVVVNGTSLFKPKRPAFTVVLPIHEKYVGGDEYFDLTVTRFYSPQHVYQIMRRIHEFDGALREAFESGTHDQGIYFLQRDAARRLVPCSPNKLLFSDVVSIRPGRRLVLSGFQTVARSVGQASLSKLDGRINAIMGSSEGPKLVDVADAASLLEMAFQNLTFPDDDTDDDRQAHLVALEHLSRVSESKLKGKVWLIVARDRDVARYREEGRFSNAPDTKQQKDLARSKADDVPVLMLLRQNGQESKGWRGLPFWWPVILTPRSSATVIFATKEAVAPTEPGNKDPRPLPSEEAD